MNKEQFPTIPKVLMDALVELVPERFPDLKDTDRKIWYNVGRQSIVALLQDIYDLQNTTIR